MRVRMAWLGAIASMPACLCVTVCLCLCTPRTAVAEPDRAVDVDRAADVARALAAIRKLGPDRRDALDRTVYEASRTRCHADTASPAATCLIDAARAACAGDRDCLAASDVVVTNLRSTTFFLDDVTRARLVRSSSDYHAALAGELRRRYAALAAELALAGRTPAAGGRVERSSRDGDTSNRDGDTSNRDGDTSNRDGDTSNRDGGTSNRDGDASGAAIDSFCRHRDRVVHACAVDDPACVPSLPWSRCVAAIVWFVGGTP